MDLKKELERERERRIKLEEELAIWHKGMSKVLTPEQLAATVQKQQIESLTFHLLSQRRLTSDLNNKLKAKEKQLSMTVENIESLETEVESKRKQIKKLNKELETLKISEKTQKGQRFGAAWIPSDEEVDTILSQTPAKTTTTEKATGHRKIQKSDKKPKSFKDFIQLIRRMERIKLFDAALLMNMNQDDVLLWARALERKGYVTINGLREKTVVARDKMLKTR